MHENLVDKSRNNYYIKGNLLDHLYHHIYCKLISIDFLREINTTIPQEINFIEKLEEDDGEKCILLL